MLKNVSGGVGCALRGAFRQLKKLQDTGVLLHDGQTGQGHILMAVFWKLISDEAALKSVWNCKGAGGTQCCMSCKNVVKHEVKEASGDPYICSCAEAMADRFDLRSDSDIWQAVDLLTRRHGDRDFKELEQTLGFNHSPEGLLQDLSLRSLVKPASANAYDPMHVILANGTMSWQMYDILENARMLCGVRYADLADFAGTFFLPRSSFRSPTALRKLFSEAIENSSRRAFQFKSSASELLALYPIVRDFLMQLSEEERQQLKMPLRTFLRLCVVVDLYLLMKKGRTSRAITDAFEAAVNSYMRSHNRSNGEDAAKPKHHLQMHLPAQLRDWGFLCVDCFCLERRHALGKRVASDVKWTCDYERSVLLRSTALHSGELNKLSFDDAYLDSRVLCQLENMRVSCDLSYFGERMAATDIVVSDFEPKRAFKVLGAADDAGVFGLLVEELAFLSGGNWRSEWREDAAAEMQFLEPVGFSARPYRRTGDVVVILHPMPTPT